MKKVTNRVALLVDGKEYEIYREGISEFVYIHDKWFTYPTQVSIEKEYISTLPKVRFNWTKENDWDKAELRFNRAAWELLKGRKFFLEEKGEDRVSIDVFEPSTDLSNVHSISDHFRDIEIEVNEIDFESGHWHVMEKIAEDRFAIKLD
jgi:hypothetical protein